MATRLSGQVWLTMTTTSMVGQAVQSGLSTAMVDASAAERAREGWTAKDMSTTWAMGAVQLDATPLTTIVTLIAMGARARPSATQLVASVVQ
jgi:hypothetical protein